MTSKKYDRVYIDLSDIMASSNLHQSWDYFKICVYLLICLHVTSTNLVTGLPHPQHIRLQYNYRYFYIFDMAIPIFDSGSHSFYV